ncbi:NAD-dependent epimerase/dehydratase family protein [Nocardia sp. NBC_00508]|uniref:NAD-dependent epimerase/dehydratase family protein n=1 Tax=Nocardia sp. NBC_00508 TaxID=2975992 RepID=UPI002E819D66|nr:NAD-dependent epimerase/dehydratase family protein [Nocardia sp. NBC_00508]WUD68731.1 NAD-dependent epimerase/dehydratase family protein [Nocardia sp. NBC_00508]
MRVLVTGANGYLGRPVIDALEAAGHDPIAMVRTATSSIHAPTRVADLLDEVKLREALDGVEAVCHLAGLTRARESTVDPLRYFRANTAGTIALLDAMAATGVPRIVFASTGSIYGSPERQPMTEDMPDAPPHPYAASKLAAEFAIHAQAQAGNLSAVVLRLLNVAGGADPDPTRLIPRALAAARQRSALEINGDGSTVRDYLHIVDAAAAFVACVENMPPLGKATRYNVGSGQGTSILVVVVAAVERVTGHRIHLVHRPPVPEPAALIGNPSKAIAELRWYPAHSHIDGIVRDTRHNLKTSNSIGAI